MYIYKVKHKYIQLIKMAIKILNHLQVPVADRAIFVHCRGASRLGWCREDDKYGFRIAIIDDMGNADEIVNVVIHELLHTIPNDNYTAHGGNWKKWATYVSNNSKYKITVRGSYERDFTLYAKCICPLCGKEYMAKKEFIVDIGDRSGMFGCRCKKCRKLLYVTLPNHPLKTMNISDRTLHIKKLLNSNPTLNEVLKCLDYSGVEDTRLIVKYCLRNFKYDHFEHNCHLYTILGKHFDDILREELANEYCNGLWDKYINSKEERYSFEMFFACTKWWMPVTKHTNKFFLYE